MARAGTGSHRSGLWWTWLTLPTVPASPGRCPGAGRRRCAGRPTSAGRMCPEVLRQCIRHDSTGGALLSRHHDRQLLIEVAGKSDLAAAGVLPGLRAGIDRGTAAQRARDCLATVFSGRGAASSGGRVGAELPLVARPTRLPPGRPAQSPSSGASMRARCLGRGLHDGEDVQPSRWTGLHHFHQRGAGLALRTDAQGRADVVGRPRSSNSSST
jgi:hypothetical protein